MAQGSRCGSFWGESESPTNTKVLIGLEDSLDALLVDFPVLPPVGPSLVVLVLC